MSGVTERTIREGKGEERGLIWSKHWVYMDDTYAVKLITVYNDYAKEMKRLVFLPLKFSANISKVVIFLVTFISFTYTRYIDTICNT